MSSEIVNLQELRHIFKYLRYYMGKKPLNETQQSQLSWKNKKLN